MVDEKVSFDTHISGTIVKANRMLGLIKKTFKTRTPQVLLPIFKANVRSILEFGNIIWAPRTQAAAFRIEQVQKRFHSSFPEYPIPQ